MKKIKEFYRAYLNTVCSEKSYRVAIVLILSLLLSGLNAFAGKRDPRNVRSYSDGKEVTVVADKTVVSDPVQQRTVKGKVTDANTGEALAGVNIVVKGTTIGTITDGGGNFTITVPAGGNKLVFSFIGMITLEADIQDNMSVEMKSDQIGLEEVVVLGYGTAKKRDVIGSVAKISSSAVVALSSPSINSALQGAGSGLMVNQASGNPGSTSSILVRGIHSLSLSSAPLWVVDGIIIATGSSGAPQFGGYGADKINAINPNDVESIEVLKDAAATSIYGSRGSNGVILITTKSGKEGVASNDISYSQGIGRLTRYPLDYYNVANTTEWFDIMETARANAGITPVEWDPMTQGGINSIDPTASLTRAQALTIQTNWYDQILRTASFKEINLSSSRGFQGGSYYISANYRLDESPIKNEYQERVSIRMNLNYSMTKNLSIDAKLSGSYNFNDMRPNAGGPAGNNNTALGGWNQAWSNYSWMPVYKPEAPTELWNTLSGFNLVASNNPKNIRAQATQYRILGVTSLNYNVPLLKGLSLRSELSIDLYRTHGIGWTNTIVRRVSKYGMDSQDLYRHLGVNAYATFDRSFGNHHVTVVTGIEEEMNRGENIYLEGDGLTGVLQQMGQPTSVFRSGSFFGSEKYQRGYFGRANYKFKDKYLLGISYRLDGTSEFIPENRWGVFTAFSAGWIITDENFMKNIKAINFLKLRGSFGQTGNDKVPGGLNTPGYQTWFRYGPRAWNIAKGTAIDRMVVTDVTWETTNSSDFGIDFGVLNNRISGSVAYYNQKVDDLLLAVPIPISSGLFTLSSSSIWANIGDMKNFGFEFNINTVNYANADFKWTSSINFTTNESKVLKLSPVLDQKAQGLISGAAISRTGHRYNAIYMAEYAGLDPNYGYPLIYMADNNVYLLDEAGQPTTELNPNYLHRYIDTAANNLGNYRIIPATSTNLANNKVIFEDKTTRPTFVGGFSNTVQYKGIDFTFSFTFSGGNYTTNSVMADLESLGGQVASDLKERSWTPTNKTAPLRYLKSTNRYDVYDENGVLVAANQAFGDYASKYLVRGDYVRFRTIRLGYEFPKSIVQKILLKGLNIYVAADNLWTWAPHYSDLDPETGGMNIPPLKTFYAGVNLKF